MWNLSLPFYSRVIFVDWNGVLNRARFWQTLIVEDPGLARDVLPKVAALFEDDLQVSKWMRGESNTIGILDRFVVGKRPDRESCLAYLEELAVRECARAYMSRRLVKVLRASKQSYTLALASDNMDCFAVGLAGRRDCQRIFDDYLVSSEIGALKENPESFFGGWLRARGLDFDDSVLVDDSPSNCAAFESAGGTAILFDGSSKVWETLASFTAI